MTQTKTQLRDGAWGIDYSDSVKARWGTDNDLEIYHDGHSRIKTATGAAGNLVIDSNYDLNLRVNYSELSVHCKEDGAVELYHNNAKKLETTSTGITASGKVLDDKGDLRNVPNSSKTGAYELVATDGGKAIHITTGGITVPNAVFAGGEAVTIVNASGSNQTITQATSLTMYNASDAATGNRTLAGRGVATIWFHNGSTAYISGAGLS